MSRMLKRIAILALIGAAVALGLEFTQAFRTLPDRKSVV